MLGGASSAPFVAATAALDARLRDGRVVTIDGARHAAHHTHAVAFVAAIEAFLGRSGHGRLTAMDWIGWIILGFIAGALSGAVVGGRTARGCLPNVVVGILGAIVGGWIAQQLSFGQAQGFLAAVVVAVIGAIVVRVILEAVSPNDRR